VNDKDKNKQNESVNRRQGILGLVGRGKRPWVILIFAAAALTVWVLWGSVRKAGPAAGSNRLSTFPVRRDDLTITVTESGSTKARQTIDIRSEVYGEATIISLIPEGTYITQEDVNNGKLLVELDSSSLEERLKEEEKGLASDEATLIEAQENYHIQLNQNESDITAAQLAVKFALMDFQKYLGRTVAQRVIEQAEADPNLSIDMTSLLKEIDDPNLGGEASQELKRLMDNITLAESKLQRAEDTLGWTVKLRERGYVSDTELQADKLDRDSLKIQKEQAVTALDLFKLYDFPKQVEQLLSLYREAGRELQRTEARARSRMAQAQARLSNAEEDVTESRQDVQRRSKQVAACIIRAPAPGLVVYGSSGEPWRQRERGPIQEGGKVYQRQKIISLPNTAEMIVEIRVHESSVDKVRPGQSTTITVEAFPDTTFHGKVLNVAPLPDPQRGFLSPDVKVYTTKVNIEGSHDSLRPGMSAKVEILVDQLDDVLIVPVQVVANREGKKLCYVMAYDTPQPREVSTGAFNDTFVEIISGLEEGEQVLLNPPRLIEPSGVAKSTEARKLPPDREPPGDTPPKAGPRAVIAKSASGVEK
jgi:HlyD family secretion protein